MSSRVLSVAHRRPCFACDQSPHLELFKVPGRLSYKDRQADSRERGGRRKESSQQASYKGTSTKEGCQQAGIPSRAGWWSRSRAGTCCASPGAVRRRRSGGRRGQDWPSQRGRSCTFARPPAVYHREDIGGGVGTKRRKKTSCRWLRPELPLAQAVQWLPRPWWLGAISTLGRGFLSVWRPWRIQEETIRSPWGKR